MNRSQEIPSPDGTSVARIELGAECPSCITTGHGRPYRPTTVSIFRRDSPNQAIVMWHEDSESTGVEFSSDSRYVEILWEIAGCILNSSGTRYWRSLYHLPTGLEITHDSSDFHRDQKTSHCLSPAQGTISHHVADALEQMVRTDFPSHGEAIAPLQVIVDSGVDVSSNVSLLRLLFRILLRDISMGWSEDEVALRLLAVKLLHRVDIRDPGLFLRDLLPRGQTQEPNRQEHNRLLDDFIARLAPASKRRWWQL